MNQKEEFQQACERLSEVWDNCSDALREILCIYIVEIPSKLGVLWWGKHNGAWGIYWRHAGDDDVNDSYPMRDIPIQIRLHAVGMFTELYSACKKRAAEQTKEIEDRASELEHTLADLKSREEY